MGKMMASGEAVPITALQGVTSAQAESLKDKGIGDVEALAAVSVDDLVDILDLSLDEAEKIINSAKVIVEARNAAVETPKTEDSSTEAIVEDHDAETETIIAEEKTSDETSEADNTSATTEEARDTQVNSETVDAVEENAESISNDKVENDTENSTE